MSKRKPGRFCGDRWFQRKVEERMRKEMRNLQSCEKLLAGSIASLRGTAWYEKEFCRQAELFREERNSQAAQRTALKRTASLKAKIENDTLLARDKTWAAEHTDDSDAQLLDYLHRCAANLGHTPLRREVLGSTYIAERFGSWAMALTMAKLPLPKSIKPPKETTINVYLKRQAIINPKKKANWPETIISAGGENMEKPKEFDAKMQLNSQECQLIQMIRELDYGQLTITVKAGKPIHVDEIRKSIPLK